VREEPELEGGVGGGDPAELASPGHPASLPHGGVAPLLVGGLGAALGAGVDDAGTNDSPGAALAGTTPSHFGDDGFSGAPA
jgi:hypothetical protein